LFTIIIDTFATYSAAHCTRFILQRRCVIFRPGGLRKIFRPPLEKCVGHSLKNLGHSQKTFRPPLVSQVGYGPGDINESN